MREGGNVLTWLHVGDLHVTAATEQNYRDLQSIVACFRGLAPGAVEFVVLPGDNADDGTPAQFALVRDAIAGLPMPVHILPGDHDFKTRSLAGFHGVLGAAWLPHAYSTRGHHCVFLDVVSAGAGGPDFRLDGTQLDWLEREIQSAEEAEQDVVVFMHTYPADLREGATELGRLLRRPHVVCVDMGHTHYNELANDGGTIFMATRSTGQIEEGPVGFSVAAVDGRGVSWRFKPLDEPWPLVLVTRPVDRRLVTEANALPANTPVRAKVLSDAPVEAVEARVGDGPWQAMQPVGGAVGLWELGLDVDGPVTVRARDAQGRSDSDRVEPALSGWQPPTRAGDGSDRDSVGAWPEKGIFGTQLGPNRNGRKW